MGLLNKGITGKVQSHICIKTVSGNKYADLRVNQRAISLGRFDPSNPTELLEIALRSMSDLTLQELEGLRVADKSMREANRKTGRPRKHRRQ